MTMARHAWYMTVRDLRALWRQPWYVAITLLQPVIWLLLFGALFKSVAQIPGFGSASYVDFLTPGIVMMTSLFSAGWSGMSTIQELERGTLDRLLTSPLKRVSLIAGRVLQSTAVVAIQSVIILAIAYAAGARFGLGGAAALLVFAGLLGAAFAARAVASLVDRVGRDDAGYVAIDLLRRGCAGGPGERRRDSQTQDGFSHANSPCVGQAVPSA